MRDTSTSWTCLIWGQLEKKPCGFAFLFFVLVFFLKLSNGCLVWFGFVVEWEKSWRLLLHVSHGHSCLSKPPCALQQTRDVLDY